MLVNASGFIIDTPAAFAVPGPQADNKYSFVKTCVEAFGGECRCHKSLVLTAN